MGRPSSYTDEALEKAIDYLNNHETTYGDPVPIVAGLAYVLGTCEKTVYNWGKDHPDFLQTLRMIQDKQHIELVKKGLTNVFSPTIAKLMLSNHGYSDRQELTHQGSGGGPVEFIMVSPNDIPRED